MQSIWNDVPFWPRYLTAFWLQTEVGPAVPGGEVSSLAVSEVPLVPAGAEVTGLVEVLTLLVPQAASAVATRATAHTAAIARAGRVWRDGHRRVMGPEARSWA